MKYLISIFVALGALWMMKLIVAGNPETIVKNTPFRDVAVSTVRITGTPEAVKAYDKQVSDFLDTTENGAFKDRLDMSLEKALKSNPNVKNVTFSTRPSSTKQPFFIQPSVKSTTTVEVTVDLISQNQPIQITLELLLESKYLIPYFIAYLDPAFMHFSKTNHVTLTTDQGLLYAPEDTAQQFSILMSLINY